MRNRNVEDQTMAANAEKRSTRKNQDPIKTIRRGAIAASIWRRQTPTGFEYLDFTLSRSWKLKNGQKEGYSQCFFDRNEEALVWVVHEACEFIRAQQGEGAATTSADDANQPQARAA